jgi:hypothetical protein
MTTMWSSPERQRPVEKPRRHIWTYAIDVGENTLNLPKWSEVLGISWNPVARCPELHVLVSPTMANNTDARDRMRVGLFSDRENRGVIELPNGTEAKDYLGSVRCGIDNAGTLMHVFRLRE